MNTSSHRRPLEILLIPAITLVVLGAVSVEMVQTQRRVDGWDVFLGIVIWILILVMVGFLTVISYTNVRHQGGRLWISYLWKRYDKRKPKPTPTQSTETTRISCGGCGASKEPGNLCSYCGQ